MTPQNISEVFWGLARLGHTGSKGMPSPLQHRYRSMSEALGFNFLLNRRNRIGKCRSHRGDSGHQRIRVRAHIRCQAMKMS